MMRFESGKLRGRRNHQDLINKMDRMEEVLKETLQIYLQRTRVRYIDFHTTD